MELVFQKNTCRRKIRGCSTWYVVETPFPPPFPLFSPKFTPYLPITLPQGPTGGKGRSEEIITANTQTPQGSWLIIKFWASSMACVKVSICLFLRRLMLGQDRVRNAFNVVIVFVICWACVPFFYTIFFCSPVAYYWDRTIEGGSCVDDDQYILESILSGVISLVTDLIILMLPMPSIWHLKISFKKKVAVTCILCVGVMCVALPVPAKFLFSPLLTLDLSVCVFSLLRCVQFAYFDTAHLSSE